MRKFFCLVAVLFGLLSFPVTTEAQDYDSLFRSFRADSLTWEDKRFLQTALAFQGYYNGLLDGDWGPRSQRAMESYSRQAFGSATEDWHMAVLAFSFFDIYERDGWGVRYFGVLDMSMLYPYRNVIDDPATDSFINWRHQNSSLSYSIGIHTHEAVQRLHDYTESTIDPTQEPYVLRRSNFAITSVTQRGGGVLYTRSNYINGAWHTIMLSANRRDVPILNAVAASISVGTAPSISLTQNGTLETVILKTVSLLAEEDETPQSSRDAGPAQASSAQPDSSGTGFVVREDGQILTNAHVVHGCTEITFDGLNATIVSLSEDFDLALLNVPDWGGTAVAEFSPSPARLNSDVTVVGFPLAGILSGLNVTRGAVSSNLGFGGEVGGMQITAPVQSGNSGGPVLAADGEVVGVVVSKLDAQVVADVTGDTPQNVNFAVRGELAKLFLFQHGIEPTLGSSDDVVAPTDLAEMASAFTGFIECKR